MLLTFPNGVRSPRLVFDMKWLKATECEGEKNREIEISESKVAGEAQEITRT